MKACYVSFVDTPDYIPGVFALQYSLRCCQSAYPFLLLVTPNIPLEAREFLEQIGIRIKLVEIIKNPTASLQHGRFKSIYTKLHIFDLEEFQKIIYLDCDMIVCQNIDALIKKRHMSAVNAGGAMPEYSHWKDLNGGLLVVEPKKELFEDMIRQVPIFNVAEEQAFLHMYYPDWKDDAELHLDHGYNMYPGFLDRYHDLYGYDLDNKVRVLHFWGPHKPWNAGVILLPENRLLRRSIQKWNNVFQEGLNSLNPSAKDKLFSLATIRLLEV
jgi:lipopolysaccharide biosynthesis glycosyltransferase